MHIIHYIIIFLVILLFLLYVLKYIVEKLLFFPNKDVPLDELPCEFNIHPGINGIFNDMGDQTPIVIYSHGNAGNIFDRANMALKFMSKGLSILMYDYRGFGRSANLKTTTKSIIDDGEAIFHYVQENYPNRKVILCGESMGSAVSYHLASKYDVDGLIILSGYSSLAEVINGFVPILGTLLSYIMYLPDNYRLVDKISCKRLIFHSSDDELIPFSQAIKMSNNSHECELVETVGGHNSPSMYGITFQKISEFASATTSCLR